MAASSGGQGKSTTHVSFVCQKCSAPVKLNRTLNPKTLVELARDVESSIPSEEEARVGGAHLRVHTDTRIKAMSDPGGEFKVSVGSDAGVGHEGAEEVVVPLRLPRSSPQTRSKLRVRHSLETLSVLYDSLPPKLDAPGAKQDSKNTLKQIQIASETFKLFSSLTDVDHPLCSECPQSVLDGFVDEIRHQERAKRLYEAMAARLEEEVVEYKKQIPELDRELQDLRREEEVLKEKLVKTEEKRRQIAEEMVMQHEREQRLQEEEQVYWEGFNEYQGRVLELRDEQRSVDYQLYYTTEQLERLKKTNVLNAAFHIWHNGHFGTINGLRLGRLQTVPVEWSEINAALGQAAFLLVTLARNAGAKFQRFRVVPYGNQSFVEVLEGKKKSQHLPLYSSAGLRIFADSKFDLGLVAFLDCLGQLKDHIEAASGGKFALPYKIIKDRLGNGKEFFSVKTQFNTLEGWTKALKFVLTDLRWALTWVSTGGMGAQVDL